MDADAGCSAGSRRLSGGCRIAPAGGWDTGNQALAISRGSRSASLHTPEHDRCFPGMLLSHQPFGIRLAIRPRDLPPNLSRLCRGYDRAPRGADPLAAVLLPGWGAV